MNDLTTFPRLPREVARTLYRERRNLSSVQLAAVAATRDERQEWHPTVPIRVHEELLRQLRTEVIEIASDSGFPVLQPKGKHVAFDQALACKLYQRMQIAPAEAAAGGIWSFLALVLLPDVAAWRYPDWSEDRFIGSNLMIGDNRHVFGRLWPRMHVLGSEVSSALGEDNAVQIMERSTFGGDPHLARAIGEAHIRALATSGIGMSQELMRDAIKRLRRFAVIVSFGMLTDEELVDLLDEAFGASAKALRA